MSLATAIAQIASGSCCKGCRRPGSLLCLQCALGEAESEEDARIDGVERVVAPWAYAGIPRSLVLDLKVRFVRGAAAPLADGIVRAVIARRTGVRALSWVPGDAIENRVRGFDHAEQIAQRVARELGLPLVGLLTKRAGTSDQTSLSRAARRANLRDAFVSRPCSGAIGLIDDVVTTGATAGSCAAALKEAGSGRVEVFAACRA